MTVDLDKLARLRMECEFLLMEAKKEEALARYDEMVALSGDPFLYIGKAKLLESLGRENDAIASFRQALQLTEHSEELREEIIRLILELDPTYTGILKFLARQIDRDIGGNSVQPCTLTMCPREQKVLKENHWINSPTVIIGHTQRVEKTEILSAEEAEPGTVLPGEKTECLAQDAPDTHGVSVEKTISGRDAALDRAMPQNFGRYQLLEKLGEGGMGTVYKAQDVELGRTVALKVIRGEGIVNQQHAMRFFQEVKATARLHHPNIVAIYEFGEYPQHYFTMEYVAGKTLASVVREGILKSPKAGEILKSVCRAIDCAHAAKIIHRDLKPGNIMIDDTGNVKVMDFGLAKFLESETGLSRSGDIMGTPVYMAPEQAQGKDVDERSDVYALGAVGYEMLTGRPLFSGDTLFKILQQVSHQEPVRPRAINADVHADMETIVLKCLEKNAAKRYQSAREVAEELERYLGNRPILAKPPTTLARVGKWVRRNRELSVAIAAVFLAVIAVFTYVAFQWRQQLRHNQALNIIADVLRWDKNAVSYDDDVKPAFERAAALAPTFRVYNQWGYFCLQYAHAHLDERNRYYEEALRRLETSIALNPDDYVSMHYISLIYTILNENEKARSYSLRMLETARKMKPENEFKYVLQAVAHREHAMRCAGQEKEESIVLAIQGFQKSTHYNPGLFCSYNALGELYLELKQYREAEAMLDRSLEVAPVYQRAFFNRGRLHLEEAVAHLGRGDYADSASSLARAENDLCHAASLAPAQDIYYQLAKLYSLKKDKEHALANLRLAIEGGITEAIEAEPALSFIRETQEYRDLLHNR